MATYTPVDHDPFAPSAAPKLTPVDHDPFAAAPKGIQQRDPFSYSPAETAKMKADFVAAEKQPTLIDEYVVKPVKQFAADTVSGIKMLSLPVAGAIDSLTGNSKQMDRLAAPGGQIDQLRDFSAEQAPAAETGKVGRFVRGIEQMVPDLVAGPMGLANMMGKAATNRPADLVREGVDAGTATKTGMVGLAATAAMTRLPMAAKSVTGTIAKGGIGNVAAGQTATAVENAVLGDKYKQHQGAMFDPEQMGEQFAMGAGFGLHQRNAIKSKGIQPGPSYFEKKAGEFLGSQAPKAGTSLESVMKSNLAEADQLSTETGAKFSLGQASNVPDFIAKERALSTRSGEAVNKAGEVEAHNTAVIQKLINEVGGNEGDIHDVRAAITSAQKDLAREIDFSKAQLEQEGAAASAKRQQSYQDLLDRRTHLEESLARAEELVKEQVAAHTAERQAFLDVNREGAKKQGDVILDRLGVRTNEDIGKATRQTAMDELAKDQAISNEKYAQIDPYRELAIPDTTPLQQSVTDVLAKHGDAFRGLIRDKGDDLSRGILRRLVPETEDAASAGRPPEKMTFREEIDPVSLESVTEPAAPAAPEITLGDILSLGSNLKTMRREARAKGEYDLADSLGRIIDGGNAAMETVADAGLKGKFAEPNVHSAEDYADIHNAMSKNQFFTRNKSGKKFSTDSDFTAFMQKNYPSATGYPKDLIMGAVEKAAANKFSKMTDAERTVIDGINRDMAQAGGTAKGANFDATPLELIKEANRNYAQNYVPKWRYSKSPGTRILEKTKDGNYKVQEAELGKIVIPSNNEGFEAGNKYNETFGDNLKLAQDHADAELTSTAFKADIMTGERSWDVPAAERWLAAKSNVLKKVGLYDQYHDVVRTAKIASELAKHVKVPTEKDAAAWQAREDARAALDADKKALGGQINQNVIPETSIKNLPEAQRLQALQKRLQALEKSPSGVIAETDASAAIGRYMRKANGNFEDAITQTLRDLGGNETARQGFKREVADFLYQEWLSNSSRTVDGQLKPTTGRAMDTMEKYKPLLETLFTKAEQRKLEQARKIVEITARGDQNVFKGSETVPHSNAAAALLKAVTIVSYIPVVKDFTVRIGQKAGQTLNNRYASRVDEFLMKARFDPEYAQKLIEISAPKSTRAMARQLWAAVTQENMFPKK